MSDSISINKIKLNEDGSFQKTDGKNVLLLSMSTLPRPLNPIPAYYFAQKKGESSICYAFKGISQLEAGTKLMISKLAEQGKIPDKIIVFATHEALEENVNYENKTAVQVYSENVAAFIENGADTGMEEYCNAFSKTAASQEERDIKSIQIIDISEKIKSVYHNNSLNAANLDSNLSAICKYIDVECINFDNNALEKTKNILNGLSAHDQLNLFVDLQGGIRTFMFTLFATLTTMRDKNATISDMFAINFNNAYQMHPIEILNKEYAIIDLVSGIRAFTGYGKVEELKRFLATRNVEGNEKKLLSIMEQIDGNMQINNPQGFMDELKKLKENDGELLKVDTYKDAQFRLIVEDLKDTYKPLLKDNVTILDQIGWLADKAFLTSALTFVEDKIPAYILKCPGDSAKNDKKVIINVRYGKKLTDDDICKYTNGKNYYVKQNNIFNAGFNKIIENWEHEYVDSIFEYWADKLIPHSGKAEAKVFYKEIKLFSSIFERVSDCEERNYIFANLEKKLNKFAWNDVTLNSLIIWSGKTDIEIFKILNIDKTPKDKLIKDLINRNQKKINYDSIKRCFLDEDHEKYGCYCAVSKYYENNICSIDYSDGSERQLAVYCLKTVLDYIFYATDVKNNTENFCNVVNNSMVPLLGGKYGKYSIMNVTKSSVDIVNMESGDRLNFNDYKYSLWKDLFCECSSVNGDNLTQMVKKYVENRKEEYGKELEEAYVNVATENIRRIGFVNLDDLTRFAYAYASYQKEIDGDVRNATDKKCSYQNVELYARGSHEQMKIYDKYFVRVNGRFLHTAAGLYEREYEKWLTVEFGYENNRMLLDSIISLYKALKQERNTTNHANDHSEKHMDYRYTKTAICVLTEMLRRIQKDGNEAIQ